MQSSLVTTIRILADVDKALSAPKVLNVNSKSWVFDVGDICLYHKNDRLKMYDAFVLSYENGLEALVDKLDYIKTAAPYAPVIVLTKDAKELAYNDNDLTTVDCYLPHQTLLAPEFIYLLDAHIAKQKAFRERDLLASNAKNESPSHKELIEQLEQAHNENHEFVYVASHDLKSPLQGVLTVLEWIDEDFGDSINAELSKNLNLIRSRVVRTHKLLSDLLHYSRINRFLTQYQTFDFTDVENYLLGSIPGIESFNLDISVGASIVHLPKEAISTVLFHLAKNAVEHHHSHKGKIQIKVIENDTEFRITVSDDGPGIEPKYRDKIFKVFQTLQSKDKKEGSGIGLAVVRKIVNHYDGDIQLAETGLLGGATFNIRWPKHTC